MNIKNTTANIASVVGLIALIAQLIKVIMFTVFDKETQFTEVDLWIFILGFSLMGVQSGLRKAIGVGLMNLFNRFKK